MELDLEKLIEEMDKSVKEETDLSVWKNNRKTSSFLNLIATLRSLPKARIASPDLMRIKNQVLDRISIPVEAGSRSGYVFNFAKMLRMGAIAMASLVVFIGSVAGVAAAALNSTPGQAFYPLKKVAENLELKLANDNQKAVLQMQFANNRMNEIQTVLAQKEAGELSEEQTQQLLAGPVRDLQKTTSAAARAATTSPKVVSKLADLSTQLRAASIQSEGSVKAEIEKAIETTQISHDEAIQNLENAGMQVEGTPLEISNLVSASGKLTAVSETIVSIGTAKFLINKDTKYVNITGADLAVDQVVDIEAQIKDNKTYAQKITLISEVQSPTPPASEPDNSDTTTNTETPTVQ